jgi:hypothetical protein
MRIAEVDRHGSTRLAYLAVHDGRVACPQRGIVDLGRCLSCASYRGFRDGRPERLICAADEFLVDAGPHRDR